MPSYYRIAAAVALAAAVDSASGGSISMPLQRVGPVYELGLVRRGAGTPQLSIANNITGAGYYATAGIGTPPQNISFVLDTGSTDTWVNSVDVDLCSNIREQAELGYCMRQFNPDKSSTFKTINHDLNVTYLDGRTVEGDYFNDTVTIDGKVIKAQQLGLALKSVRPTGVMGLGFDVNEATDQKYPSIVTNMVTYGIIDHPAYSLYLNDIHAKSGTILFGGIDSAKYVGSLAILKMQPLPGTAESKGVNITSFAVTINSVTSPNAKLPAVASGSVAVLDSGSTISLLPDALVEPIYDQYGVVVQQGLPEPMVDCKYGSGAEGNATALSFAFDSGANISVPTAEMVIDVFPKGIQQAIMEGTQDFANWTGVCLFGIAAASSQGVKSDQFYLLGDTFLRSAYVVYDLGNKQIGMAQADPDATKSNISVFQSGATSFPNGSGTISPSSGSSGKDSAASSAGPATAALILVLGVTLAVL